jgi:hypothetical protein
VLDPKTATLEEAKAWLRERFGEGADCPCCHQYVKLYKRKLNSGMAAGLVIMYRSHLADRKAPFDTHALLFRGSRLDADFAKLRFWELIERVEIVDDGVSHPRRGSKYRITDLGCQFVERQISVPKYVHLYNDSPVKSYDDLNHEVIDLDHALGSKFNYQELMTG